MKYALCVLVLGAVPALSQTGGGPAAPFTTYPRFEHEPSALVLDSLRQELTAIMSPVGLHFAWRPVAAAYNGETFAELALVTFKGTCQGTCDVSAFVSHEIEAGALGWTHRTDGRILHFSEVDCDRIRAFLSWALFPLSPRDRQEAFGRAVARVLAHELYHVFTQTAHHGSSGLAKGGYTVRDLMAGSFHFEEADLHALAALPVIHRLRVAGGPPLPGRLLFAGSGCIRCHGPQGEGTNRGPSLRPARPSLELDELGARLKNRASKMYRRARDLGALWPSLARPDIEGLVSYLNTSLE